MMLSLSDKQNMPAGPSRPIVNVGKISRVRLAE